MNILMVTGVEGALQCATAISAQLGMEVEVVAGRKPALAALREREFAAVVVDETLADCDPVAAETIWERAGLAIPLQVKFGLSGIPCLNREIRAAMQCSEREQILAHQEVSKAMETKLKTTLDGLLLHSQLALADNEVPAAVAERPRVVAELVDSLYQQLGALLHPLGTSDQMSTGYWPTGDSVENPMHTGLPNRASSMQCV